MKKFIKKIIYIFIMLLFFMPNFTFAQGIEFSWEKNLRELTFVVCFFDTIAIIYIGLKISKVYRNYKKALNEEKQNISFKYNREVIKKVTLTPGEVFRIVRQRLETPIYDEILQIFVATILNLKLKNKIDFVKENDDSQKLKIKFLATSKYSYLKKDEKTVMEFLEKASQGKDLTLQELKYYMLNHEEEVSKMQQKIEEATKESVLKQGFFDQENYIKKDRYVFFIGLMMLMSFSLIAILVVLSYSKLYLIMIFSVILYCEIFIYVYYKMVIYREVLTDKGRKEKNRWRGIQNYVEDYSLIKDRGTEEVVLWEYYMVYATALGSSKKVIKQFSISYPDFIDLLKLKKKQ